MSTYTNPYFSDHIDKSKINTIIEVGADNGSSTIRAHEFYKAKIYTLECNPDTLPTTRENLKQYDDIVLIEAAAWDKTGLLRFMSVDTEKSIAKEKANSSCFKWNPALYQSKERQNLKGIIQKEVLVKSITLDDLCKKHPIGKVDLLCMDAQGAELKILQGAECTLKNVIYIITEVNYKPQYEGSCVYEEVKEFLRTFGFIIKAENGVDIVDRVFENVLFVRKGLA